MDLQQLRTSTPKYTIRGDTTRSSYVLENLLLQRVFRGAGGENETATSVESSGIVHSPLIRIRERPGRLLDSRASLVHSDNKRTDMDGVMLRVLDVVVYGIQSYPRRWCMFTIPGLLSRGRSIARKLFRHCAIGIVGCVDSMRHDRFLVCFRTFPQQGIECRQCLASHACLPASSALVDAPNKK